MPNSKQSSTLRDSRFSPDLCLSFVLSFEMLPGFPYGHFPAPASSQQGFASFMSQQNQHQMRLYSAGCSGLKLLILLNFSCSCSTLVNMPTFLISYLLTLHPQQVPTQSSHRAFRFQPPSKILIVYRCRGLYNHTTLISPLVQDRWDAHLFLRTRV